MALHLWILNALQLSTQKKERREQDKDLLEAQSRYLGFWMAHLPFQGLNPQRFQAGSFGQVELFDIVYYPVVKDGHGKPSNIDNYVPIKVSVSRYEVRLWEGNLNLNQITTLQFGKSTPTHFLVMS